MDKSSEDIQTLNYLIQSLSNQLTESSNQINALEQNAKRLVSKEEYEELCQRRKEDTKEDMSFEDQVEEEESKLIYQLQRERLEHIMEIQKQDFMTEKLLELNEQNKGIIESVKEFFQHKQEVREDDELMSKERANYYIDSVIKPNLNLLDLNINNLTFHMKRLEGIFTNLSDNIDVSTSRMFSQEYQSTLNEVILSLNNVFENNVNS